MGSHTVQEHLYLTEDDRIVQEDDPEARWLYAVPGQEIPLAEAERYGLVGKAAPAKAAEVADAVPPAEAETKPKKRSKAKGEG